MPILYLQFSKRLKIRPQAHLTKVHCPQLQIDFNFKRYVSWSSFFNFGQNGHKDMWNLHFSSCMASVFTDNNFFFSNNSNLWVLQNRKEETRHMIGWGKEQWTVWMKYFGNSTVFYQNLLWINNSVIQQQLEIVFCLQTTISRFV